LGDGRLPTHCGPLQFGYGRTMELKKHRRGRWIIAGVAAVAALVALNFETIMWASAVLLAERRPSLLRDAQWSDPASAQLFQGEFRAGTDEEKLLVWLERNQFEIDRTARRASRLVEGLPCNERVAVTWAADGQSRLRESKAIVTEAGCL
jgi:hypothetical protein